MTARDTQACHQRSTAATALSVGRTLSFITTDECSAACAHCLMQSGPDRSAKLSFAQIRDRIDEIALTGDYALVVFTGGECTRLGDDLLDAIAYANVHGLITRAVTNSEWATTAEAAEKMIGNLREAGLQELNLSYDDFHRVWIPEANLLRAWEASKNRGFDSVVLALASGPRSRVTPAWLCELVGEDLPLAYDLVDGLRQPLPEPSADGTQYLISNSHLVRLGRGRGLRDDYATFPDHQESVMLQSCPPSNREPVITPRDHVSACCGVNPDGNRVLDFGEGSDGPTEFQHVVLGALHYLGPGHLLRMAQDGGGGLRARERYASICEMCDDVTRDAAAMAFLSDNIERLAEDVNAAAAITAVATAQGEN